jgi:hypothetical protein
VQLTRQIPEVEVQRLDLATGGRTPFIAKTAALTWMAFPAGVPVAYAQRWDRQVMRIDLTSGQLAPVEAPELREINDIRAGPGPREVLFGCHGLVVWDAAEERVLKQYTLPFEPFQVGATADGTFLYAADATRNRVALIQRESGRMTEIQIHSDPATLRNPLPQVAEPLRLEHRLEGKRFAVPATHLPGH